MVGGFGNIIYSFTNINDINKKRIQDSLISEETSNKIRKLRPHGAYLAGLIEGDGTFAIKDNDTIKSNYNPHIIIVFKLSDYKVAEHLCNLTGCGNIYRYKDRNYVLWKITTIKDVYIIVSTINGYIRTPKYETLIRYARFLNNYLTEPYYSQLKITILPLDKSSIISNG